MERHEILKQLLWLFMIAHRMEVLKDIRRSLDNAYTSQFDIYYAYTS